MAKKPLNRLKKPKKPIKIVFKQIAQKLLFLLIILAITATGYGLHKSSLFEVKINWTIDSNLHQDEAYYKQLISTLTENKYLIKLSKLKEIIEAEPWVSVAELKRIYWNKININLKAHSISMRWQDKGYISSEGVLFKPQILVNSDAPLAFVNADEVTTFFEDYKLYQSILESFVITKFERDKIDQITIEPNVVIILGHQKQKQRLQEFVKAYNNLRQNSTKIRKRGIFDMRYTKGFALSYQPQ